MEARLGGTLKTIVTALAALLLVFILVKVVLWNLYDTNVYDFLNNDAEKLGFTYSDVSKEYKGTLDKKYDATLKDPTKFNFNGYLSIAERPSLVSGTDKDVLTLIIAADYKSDFKYTISVLQIKGTEKTDKGSFDIDPTSLDLIKDNTIDQLGDKYLKTYSSRIQKLIDSANTAFGQDIK